jgi:hypothetical protein
MNQQANNWYRVFIWLPAVLLLFACGKLDDVDNGRTSEFTDCEVCHTPGTSLDPVRINGSGSDGKHVRHVANMGFDCTKCHFDYFTADTHRNNELDTDNPAVNIVFFDATNPTGQWLNDTGANTGSCGSVNCHGGVGFDWYSAAPWVRPPCLVCHSNAIGSIRPILGVSGDFGQNPAMISHHINGGTDPDESQCLVCHDTVSLHGAGGVHLRNADTGNTILYDRTDTADLEPFCLSCHDTDGATATSIGMSALQPFSDLTLLGQPPYPYATGIADSWAKTYGHGPNGHHPVADKLTCMGDGTPGSGCHGNGGAINAHGSQHEIIGTSQFSYSVNTGLYDENWFALCFNCHASYPGVTKEDVFGLQMGGILDWTYGLGGVPPYYTPMVTTHFADHNRMVDPDGLNDPVFWGENFNLHWWHLGLPSDFRGTGSGSYVVCVNCHNVHGSNTAYGAVYDPLGYVNITTGNGNTYGKMADPVYAGTVLNGHPAYCSFNCHSIQGVTRAWFDPLVE